MVHEIDLQRMIKIVPNLTKLMGIMLMGMYLLEKV